MESSSFLCNHIQRIARQQRTSTMLWLGAILAVALSGFGMLWLISLHDAGPLNMWLGLALLAVLMVGGLMYISVRPLAHAICSPLESFYLNDLRRYGPLDRTVAQIDAESGPYVGQTGSFVTPHWIISARSDALSFIRLEDIVWIYKRFAETKVTFYYIFTVSSGKSYTAQIWNRYGYYESIASTEQGVDALLAQIAQLVPWVTQGYLELLEEAWHRRRAEFIADVDRRRQQMLFVSAGGGADIPATAPLMSSLDAKPQSPQPPAGSLSSLLPGLNRAVDDKLVKEYKTKYERQVRLGGGFLLMFGIGFFVLLVLGALGGTQEVGILSAGLCVSVLLMLIGVIYLVFGPKGKIYYERALFKKWWTAVLTLIFVCGGMMLLNSLLKSLLAVGP